METSPWVEKYRPNKFEDIVLTPINKKILENIIKSGAAKTAFPTSLIISVSSECR